ncbi:MAG TPA: tRNA guanosine(34) transglycosylase Tgt [Candidatus Limnocylindria bacterium]|nr:tRNA guanosine(34) transglycosylase Tgt [Candidatus Limnocylindria bacterium]
MTQTRGSTSARSPISFELRSTAVRRARLGCLSTSHGQIDTPQFMPVGTQATVKSLTPGDLRASGAQIILANAYHLALRPGHERIARLGGLHRFTGWDGPILTDSGGFQVFSLAHLRRSDDDGVTFASHIDGSTMRLTPERAVEIQEALGSDIAMMLDDLHPDLAPLLVERNVRWAERSLAAHSRTDQALFGIIQGGVDADARRQSARATAALAFDGLAVGGLSVGETKGQMAAALDVVAEELADDARPRYLMGVGSPEDFFVAIERGIDLFDCVLPTRVARNGQVWTDAGKLNLRNARHLDDPGPIDATCSCEACRNHSRAYLAHLFRAEELLAYRLASVHNVTYTLDLMRRIRTALRDGTYASLRDVVTERYASTGARTDKPPVTP